MILAAGLLLAGGELIGSVDLIEPAVFVLAALSVITVAQRIWHVRQALHAGTASGSN